MPVCGAQRRCPPPAAPQWHQTPVACKVLLPGTPAAGITSADEAASALKLSADTLAKLEDEARLLASLRCGRRRRRPESGSGASCPPALPARKCLFTTACVSPATRRQAPQLHQLPGVQPLAALHGDRVGAARLAGRGAAARRRRPGRRRRADVAAATGNGEVLTEGAGWQGGCAAAPLGQRDWQAGWAVSSAARAGCPLASSNPPPPARTQLLDAATGMLYLHTRPSPIVHRDLVRARVGGAAQGWCGWAAARGDPCAAEWPPLLSRPHAHSCSLPLTHTPQSPTLPGPQKSPNLLVDQDWHTKVTGAPPYTSRQRWNAVHGGAHACVRAVVATAACRPQPRAVRQAHSTPPPPHHPPSRLQPLQNPGVRRLAARQPGQHGGHQPALAGARGAGGQARLARRRRVCIR